MSSRKGTKYRKKAIDYLRNNGYVVDVVERTSRWIKYKDLFSGICLKCWGDQPECCEQPRKLGGFDIVALKEDEIILIQVKTSRKPTLKDYKKFAKKYASETLKVQAYTWIKYKGFTVTDFKPDGTTEEEEKLKP